MQTSTKYELQKPTPTAIISEFWMWQDDWQYHSKWKKFIFGEERKAEGVDDVLEPVHITVEVTIFLIIFSNINESRINGQRFFMSQITSSCSLPCVLQKYLNSFVHGLALVMQVLVMERQHFCLHWYDFQQRSDDSMRVVGLMCTVYKRSLTHHC